MLCGFMQAWAYEWTDENGVSWTFHYVSETEVSILPTDTNISGAVIIPGTVYDGETELIVSSISDDAFRNCSGLTSVTIPEGVTSIDEGAFYNCSGLTSVTLPEGLKSIKHQAFHGCTGLSDITIPEGVTSIANAAFSGCSGLESVSIPSSVTSIGGRAFNGCNNLTSVYCYVTTPLSINESCFTNRTNATLYVPEGTKKAYDVANYWNEFNNIVEIEPYPTLSTVTITDDNGISWTFSISGSNAVNIKPSDSNAIEGTVTIPSKVFYEDMELTVTSIKRYAFLDCSKLKSVTIPASVTSIGELAFQGCSALRGIVVDNENTVYDSRDNCNGIIETATNTLVQGCNSTVIPSSVMSIGEYAFMSCTEFTDMTIPSSVTNIGAFAFYGCSNITSVILPEGMTNIGENAFGNCTNLRGVCCFMETPPSISSNTFSSRGNATLYVPYETINNYETSSYWNEFKEILGGAPMFLATEKISQIDNFYKLDIHPGKDPEFRLVCTDPEATIYWRYAWGNDGGEEGENEEYLISEGDYGENWYFESSMPWMTYQEISPEEEGYPRLDKRGTYWYIEAKAVHEGIYESDITRRYYWSYDYWENVPEVFIEDDDYDGEYTNPEECSIYLSETSYCDGIRYLITTDGDTESVLATVNSWTEVGLKPIESPYGDEGSGYGCTIDLSDLYGNNQEYFIYVVSTYHGDVEYYESGELANWNYESFTINRKPTEVTLTISGAGVATFASPYDLDFTDITGMKAYIASAFDPSTGKLTLTQLDEVPAGTGLYIKGAAGTYTVPVKETTMFCSNLLVGVTEDTEVSPTTDTNTNFILANGAHGIGFYTLSRAGVIPAGKAYLSLPTEALDNLANSVGLEFEDDETTGISEEIIVNSEKSAGEWYTLDGQKFDKKPTQKGVYIMDGKKIVIK